MFGGQAKSILLMIAIITAICVTVVTVECPENADEEKTSGVIEYNKIPRKACVWPFPTQTTPNQYLILTIQALNWVDSNNYCAGYLKLTGLPKTCVIAQKMRVIYYPYLASCNVGNLVGDEWNAEETETSNIIIKVNNLPSSIEFKATRAESKNLIINYEYKGCEVSTDEDNDSLDNDDDDTFDDEETKNEATQCPNAKPHEETEKPSNNTSLVILVAILGTSLIVTLIIITVMAQKLKALKNKLTDKTQQSSSPDAVMVVNDFYGEGDFQQSQQASQFTPDPTAVYAVVNKSKG
uniref:uncharacterized protein LOC120329937 n=1 Tax=Styela clava TaxID=7725 RepID=UPI0019395596|nr:uncharacterized protein LOC120329937 [Styela clava]